VRIMAATTATRCRIPKGTFRKDLYFRLNVVTISLPPLRSAVPTFPSWHVFPRTLAPRAAPNFQLRHESLLAMIGGNVRELENCLERAVALGDQSIIEVGDLPPAIANAEAATEALAVRNSPARHRSSRTDLEDIERATIERVFSQVRETRLWRQDARISRATLYRKLKRYSIAPARIRRSRRHCNRFLCGEERAWDGDSQACPERSRRSKPGAVRQRHRLPN